MLTGPEPVAGDRAFVRMATVIGAISLLVFGWFLTLGRPDLVQYRGFGEVFDLQARAFFHGRLALPDNSLGFEGFVVGGKTYAYFGVFPALARMPVFLLTDRFDGRLSGLSMLVAYVIALWSGISVVRRVRSLLRPGAPWTRLGLVAAGLLLAVVGIGSNLLFLASGAWVYHEASLWGAAGVLASFSATLRFLDRGRLRSVLAAGLWATVAWTSRGSVGLAPSVVLGLLGLAHLTGHRWLSVLAPRPPPAASALVWGRNLRVAAALLVASVAGALVFGSINAAKFGSPTSLPMDKQVASFNPWPERAKALDVYDGSLFSARLIPSVIYQSLRPDLLRPSGVWPFLRFSAERPPVWGNLVFDTVEPSAGLTVTSPLLLVLAAVGTVSALRHRPRAQERAFDVDRAFSVGPDHQDPATVPVRAAMLRPFLLGGLAAAYAPLTIAFIAQRYLTDALPFLIVASAGGVAVLDGWAARRIASARAGASSPTHRGDAVTAVTVGAFAPRSTAVWVTGCGLAAMATFGIVTTLGVTWSFQRFVIPPDPAARAAGLRAQVAVSHTVGRPPPVRRYDQLPARAPGVILAIVGPCDGLYQGQSDGAWSPIEVSDRRGNLQFVIERNGSPPKEPEAVVALGPVSDTMVLTLVNDRGANRFVLARNGVGSKPGRAVDLTGRPHQLQVRADPTFAWSSVYLDGREVLFVAGTPPLPGPVRGGVDPSGSAVPFGSSRGAKPNDSVIADRPSPTPTCDALLDAHR